MGQGSYLLTSASLMQCIQCLMTNTEIFLLCYEFSTGSKPRLQFINIRSTTGFAHSRFCSYVERHLSLALQSSSITIFNIFHFSLKGMKNCFKTYALCITDSYLIGSIYFHIIYRFEPPSIDNATPIQRSHHFFFVIPSFFFIPQFQQYFFDNIVPIKYGREKYKIKLMTISYIYVLQVNTKLYSVTSKPTQSSSRCVLSFKDSLALL